MKRMLVLAVPALVLFGLPVVMAGGVAGGGVAGIPTHDDIPAEAARAYVAAVSASAAQDPPCPISWALLAGIGKVESNHGRHGGAVLGPDGVPDPLIIGIPLDGRPGVAPIRDTDGGRLDGDDVWDRAVGPMQFIPSTWAILGRDGDGDGELNPHDIDDAARAAAAHLCRSAAGQDLTERPVIVDALFDYNRDASYGRLVMSHMDAYLVESSTDMLLAGSGPIACPVQPPVNFIDSWGFPRSGGRTHKGQDMFAAEGQPLVAVDDAVVLEIRQGAGLGGNVVWLQTREGHAWYYAHLQDFAPGLTPGDRVARGQLVGFTGRTGNAATTDPHLHIQWRPDGRRGADTNPYLLLDAACPVH